MRDASLITVPTGPDVDRELKLGQHGPARLNLLRVELEKTAGCRRPDVLLHTERPPRVALEFAYSSFCNLEKVAEFARLRLPAIEVDISAFRPEHFNPSTLSRFILDETGGKIWLWPSDRRWILLRELEFGDVAVKALDDDRDILEAVCTLARSRDGTFSRKYRNWVIPRRFAAEVRGALKNISPRVFIAHVRKTGHLEAI